MKRQALDFAAALVEIRRRGIPRHPPDFELVPWQILAHRHPPPGTLARLGRQDDDETKLGAELRREAEDSEILNALGPERKVRQIALLLELRAFVAEPLQNVRRRLQHQLRALMLKAEDAKARMPTQRLIRVLIETQLASKARSAKAKSPGKTAPSTPRAA